MNLLSTEKRSVSRRVMQFLKPSIRQHPSALSACSKSAHVVRMRKRTQACDGARSAASENTNQRDDREHNALLLADVDLLPHPTRRRMFWDADNISENDFEIRKIPSVAGLAW